MAKFFAVKAVVAGVFVGVVNAQYSADDKNAYGRDFNSKLIVSLISSDFLLFLFSTILYLPVQYSRRQTVRSPSYTR